MLAKLVRGMIVYLIAVFLMQLLLGVTFSPKEILVLAFISGVVSLLT